MSEPTSASDPTPPVPPAPSFSYGSDGAPPPPPPPAYGQPAYGAAVYGAPQGAPRRTWDLVLTIVLLVLGLFGLGIGLIYAALLSDPALFREAMQQQGYDLTVDTRSAATVIAISHVVLYLVAVGVSILLLVKRRIAFWVPLTAGVIAAIVFWGSLIATIGADPNLTGGF